MRPPPPVLPPPDNDSPTYKPTWMDREGPDAMFRLKAAGYGVIVGGLSLPLWGAVIHQQGLGGFAAIALFMGGAISSGLLSFWLGVRSGAAAGAVARAVTFPTGDSTPYEHQFSFQESLVAKGDIAGALASYEQVIADQPGLVAPRMRAAEHYARKNLNPRRAAELFREIRDTPGVPSRDELYASSRLVDLLDGPLAEPGRAVVEMRRIIERYPTSDLARRARTALPAMKQRLQAADDE